MKIEKLENKLNESNNINKLNNQNFENINISQSRDAQMILNDFISPNKNITKVPCHNTDSFSKVEERLNQI